MAFLLRIIGRQTPPRLASLGRRSSSLCPPNTTPPPPRVFSPRLMGVPFPSRTEADETRSYSERKRETRSYSTGALTTESQGHSEGEELDRHPSWRPPKPVEEGIWKPIPVETNGEGKKRVTDGDMLVEVYDVQVDLRGKTSGNIHGKVTLDCEGINIVLFNRDKESALMIQEKGSLPLDGPDLAPLGYDPIAIIVDLKIDDEELCKGLVTWETYTARQCPTDKWLDEEVQGRNGSVLVTYAVMSEACLAELDVKLIQSKEQITPLRIHGDIVVYINNMQFLRYSVFSKKSYDCSTIKPLDPIPLSRSLFCCDCDSSLVVKVDLWNSDIGKPIARGALLFPLEYYGEFVGTVGDQNMNMMQVKVNYLDHMDHTKTFLTAFPRLARMLQM